VISAACRAHHSSVFGWRLARMTPLVADSPKSDYPDVSLANQILGSQTGSRRPQTQSYIRPRRAIIAVGRCHVRRHPAMPGDVGKVPPKQ
jgi:hypothetical protein